MAPKTVIKKLTLLMHIQIRLSPDFQFDISRDVQQRPGDEKEDPSAEQAVRRFVIAASQRSR